MKKILLILALILVLISPSLADEISTSQAKMYFWNGSNWEKWQKSVVFDTSPINTIITSPIGQKTMANSVSTTIASDQPTIDITQGAALGTNTQILMGGSTTTSAPIYTTATINPLSLTTGGGLRVDLAGSAANTTAGLFSVKTDQTTHGTTDKMAADLYQQGSAISSSSGVYIRPDSSTNLNTSAVTITGALSTGTNTIGDVGIIARTSGGWSVGNFTSGDTYTALTNSAQVIKASAGQFGGYYIYNPNSSAIYVMVYNVAAASVTVGTTTAQLVFAIPAASAANLELVLGIPFSTAMSIAAATTGGGNGAPTSALEAMALYK